MARSSSLRLSKSRRADSPFRSRFEETPSPFGLAPAMMASECASPLHPELLEGRDQAESVLVHIQHLPYGLPFIEGDVHYHFSGPVPHVREGELFGDGVRPLVSLRKGFEPGPPSPEVVIQGSNRNPESPQGRVVGDLRPACL